MIVVKSSGDNTASNSMARVEVIISSDEKGTLTFDFDFPQLKGKGRLNARNTIIVDDTGDMMAKQCVAEII